MPVLLPGVKWMSEELSRLDAAKIVPEPCARDRAAFIRSEEMMMVGELLNSV
jgi:hypothetical protein